MNTRIQTRSTKCQNRPGALDGVGVGRRPAQGAAQHHQQHDHPGQHVEAVEAGDDVEGGGPVRCRRAAAPAPAARRRRCRSTRAPAQQEQHAAQGGQRQVARGLAPLAGRGWRPPPDHRHAGADQQEGQPGGEVDAQRRLARRPPADRRRRAARRRLISRPPNENASDSRKIHIPSFRAEARPMKRSTGQASGPGGAAWGAFGRRGSGRHSSVPGITRATREVATCDRWEAALCRATLADVYLAVMAPTARGSSTPIASRPRTWSNRPRRCRRSFAASARE